LLFVHVAKQLAGYLLDAADELVVLKQGVQLQLDLGDGGRVVGRGAGVEIRRVEATAELAA
jgi:hypothetical protein